MRLIRSVSTAAAMALALVAGVTAALAQASDICLQLQARLAQLERAPTGADRSHDYDTPIAQQQGEINRAMTEARRVGCLGGFLFFQPRAAPKCGPLMATIDHMRANLGRLMNARSQVAYDPFAVASERGNILRSLQLNRCNAGGPQYVFTNRDGEPGSGGLFATLFGRSRLRVYGNGIFTDSPGGDTYRTLCVRTCDGYYFPISFSTVPGQFDADAQTCQQMCPGTEAVLYTHRNPGEDVADMVSLAGEPYTSLPTAFLYRKQFDKACTCGAATASAPQFTDFATDASIDPNAALAAIAVATPPQPTLRPAPGEDPETIATRLGDLVPKPVTVPDAKSGTDVAGVTADGRKIRIVGPSFYYAQ